LEVLSWKDHAIEEHEPRGVGSTIGIGGKTRYFTVLGSDKKFGKEERRGKKGGSYL